jgi:hypothetical protein
VPAIGVKPCLHEGDITMASTIGQIISGVCIFAFFVGFIIYRHRQDLRAEERANASPPETAPTAQRV